MSVLAEIYDIYLYIYLCETPLCVLCWGVVKYSVIHSFIHSIIHSFVLSSKLMKPKKQNNVSPSKKTKQS